MRSNPKEVAIKLAKGHRESDPSTLLIKYFPSNNKEIRLLEVSKTAPTTGEIMPFRFGPDASNGIYYPSIVILLSPNEWEQIQAGGLKLPRGWSLKEAVDL